MAKRIKGFRYDKNSGFFTYGKDVRVDFDTVVNVWNSISTSVKLDIMTAYFGYGYDCQETKAFVTGTFEGNHRVITIDNFRLHGDELAEMIAMAPYVERKEAVEGNVDRKYLI